MLFRSKRSRWTVRVRIKKTPTQREIDGVSLKGMLPGAVRDVSAEVGSWLIAEEYADSEMRQSAATEDELNSLFKAARRSSGPRERRAQKR